MGMGYGANLEVIIDEQEIRKIVPEAYKELEAILTLNGISLETLSHAYYYEDGIEELDVDEGGKVFSALYDVLKAFKEQTNISLLLGHHDSSSDGSRYDQVDGAYFYLGYGDVYDLTPEAKALKESGAEFTLKSWVTFG